jgi:hypothetical protein
VSFALAIPVSSGALTPKYELETRGAKAPALLGAAAAPIAITARQAIATRRASADPALGERPFG